MTRQAGWNDIGTLEAISSGILPLEVGQHLGAGQGSFQDDQRPQEDACEEDAPRGIRQNRQLQLVAG